MKYKEVFILKKDRNTFFNEASFATSGFVPNMANIGMPFNQSTASNSFYSGPMPNYNQPMNNGNDYSDMESRLSKIERQINRMDARISKLESKDFVGETTLNNNMYML